MEQPADLEAVRASYDRVADAYVDLVVGRLQDEPWLRAALNAFAEAVTGLGPVLDVGCGPGEVTSRLAGRGLDVRGVDLSPRMIEHARTRHPGLRFDVASATALDLAPASLGGVLGWFSLFNLPRDVLPQVIADFARALVPGGQLLIGTHVGDQDLPRTHAYGGVPVAWTTHRWMPEQLVAMLVAAGLQVVAELRSPASGDQPPQVVIAARRPHATDIDEGWSSRDGRAAGDPAACGESACATGPATSMPVRRVRGPRSPPGERDTPWRPAAAALRCPLRRRGRRAGAVPGLRPSLVARRSRLRVRVL